MHTCIIIDDEARSVETLKGIITRYLDNELTLVGIASTADEGYSLIVNEKPQIVFLDVEMPQKSGIDMLEMFEEINFQIIFTTGFDQYAISAIKLSALDYLLKPINITELKEAVLKAINKINTSVDPAVIRSILDNANAPKAENRIPLPTSGGIEMTLIKDVVFCKADHDYTHVHLGDGRKSVVSKNIKYFEILFSEHDFFRTHHSYLVNKSFIRRFSKDQGGIILTDFGHEIPVSRRKRTDFVEWLKDA